MRALLLLCATAAALFSADVKSGPPLPLHPVENWARLPDGFVLGACSSVAVDSHDHVWVFSRGEHPVTEFAPDGKLLRSWDNVKFGSAHGIKVDRDGNVWTVDVGAHMVRKHRPDGTVLLSVGKPGQTGDNDSREAFNKPTNLAFGPGGEFFVSDGYENARVVKFSPEGKYLMHWGRKGAGDGEFDLVHEIFLGRANRVLVGERTNERISIFDLNGKFLGKLTGAGAPWGLAYAANENAIYLSDGLRHRVVKMNMEGEILGVLGSKGPGPGQLDAPHGIAVDSNGALYVAEVGNKRVQKFVKAR